MIRGLSHQLNTNAVMAAPALRTVMYRTSRSAETLSPQAVPSDHSNTAWLK